MFFISGRLALPEPVWPELCMAIAVSIVLYELQSTAVSFLIVEVRPEFVLLISLVVLFESVQFDSELTNSVTNHLTRRWFGSLHHLAYRDGA